MGKLVYTLSLCLSPPSLSLSFFVSFFLRNIPAFPYREKQGCPPLPTLSFKLAHNIGPEFSQKFISFCRSKSLIYDPRILVKLHFPAGKNKSSLQQKNKGKLQYISFCFKNQIDIPNGF